MHSVPSFGLSSEAEVDTGLNSKRRYVLYAAVSVLAAGAYLWMGAAPAPPPVSNGRDHSEVELPALNSFDYGFEAQERRDLFSFVKYVEQKPVSVAPPPVVTKPVPRANEVPSHPDLLANLKVIGLVRHPDEVSVLLQIGTQLRTVALGERFGEGDSLEVAAIEGRNVHIVDQVAKTSRTFVLSEE